MTNRFKHVLVTAAAVAVTTIVTSNVVSQDHGQEMPDMDAMMKEWMKMAAPGKEHRRMKKMEGTWRGESSHWQYPGAEPQVSTNIARNRSIMGGRFMIQDVTGEMDMGFGEMVFEGMGLYGYDNGAKKHFFTWVDNMGTMMMYAEGTADASGEVITYFSELPNPMDGSMMEIKTVSRMLDDDKAVMRMHMRQPDGSWFKNMEIVSTRVP